MIWVVVSVLIRLGMPAECAADSLPVRLEGWAQPADSILDYHLFKDPKRQIPNDGIVPYELTTPHYVDDATLHRFLWIPPGEQVVYTASSDLAYPPGTVIILSIGYPHDVRDPSRGEQLIETRILVYQEQGWMGLQYIWNPEGTDARLSVVGGWRKVSWILEDGARQHHRYRMPNRNECNQCHLIHDAFVPLGPVKASYVNRQVSRGGKTTNQLEDWVRRGILTGTPERLGDMPAMPIWNDPASGTVSDRARAYLDMNCSACHRPGGACLYLGIRPALPTAHAGPLRGFQGPGGGRKRDREHPILHRPGSPRALHACSPDASDGPGRPYAHRGPKPGA